MNSVQTFMLCLFLCSFDVVVVVAAAAAAAAAVFSLCCSHATQVIG